MKYFSTVMQQCLQLLPQDQFDQFVGQHNGDKWTKTFSCYNQLSVMLYAQACGKESLRELEIGLRLHSNKWYHLGLMSVARSTVADANNRRSYEIFESLFYALLQRCREHIPCQKKFSFDNQLYSLDGSIIDLCLSLFDWAKFRTKKGAIQMHTLFNNKEQIPCFLNITEAKKHELPVARDTWKKWNLVKESILVFDRAFIDYEWFNDLDEEDIFFVTRAKSNMQYVAIEQQEVTEKNVLKDEIIELVLEEAEKAYPKKLRLITYWDKENQKEFKFITNNFELSPATIAAIYKARWDIEVFFKWIKQNLKIKTFLGTSKNAVLSQIWIAMIYFLILTYIKAQTKTDLSLSDLARVFADTFLYGIPIIHLLSLTPASLAPILKARASPQLHLF